MQNEHLDHFKRKLDHASGMIFTREKERAGANPESPARTQPGKNIRERSNPRRSVFTLKKNDLFIQ